MRIHVSKGQGLYSLVWLIDSDHPHGGTILKSFWNDDAAAIIYAHRLTSLEVTIEGHPGQSQVKPS